MRFGPPVFALPNVDKLAGRPGAVQWQPRQLMPEHSDCGGKKMEEKNYSDAPQQAEEEKANWAKFEALAKQYREDASLRARIDAGDVSDSLEHLGVSIAGGVKVKIVADTADRIHFAVPPPGRVGEMSAESLSAVVGGTHTAGTAACAGSAGSFGCSCAPSTMSTAGTGGTMG